MESNSVFITQRRRPAVYKVQGKNCLSREEMKLEYEISRLMGVIIKDFNLMKSCELYSEEKHGKDTCTNLRSNWIHSPSPLILTEGLCPVSKSAVPLGRLASIAFISV